MPKSGADPKGSAQRHASWLFLLIAVVTLFALHANPDQDRTVLILATSSAAALCSGVLRLQRSPFPGRYPYLLVAAVILAFGVSTWVSGERAAMTGPGFVLAFVWIGAHYTVRVVLVAAPLAGVTYGVALVAAGSPAEQAGSAFVLIPIATLVGIVISRSIGQLREANARIGAQDRWRAAMMATLAHDVRSPLTSIVGVLELLAQAPDTPQDYQPLLGGATRQAARINRLATGLLDVERVQQGRLRLARTQVDLAALAEEIAAEHPDSAVLVQVPPELTVWADRERLEQILVNLVNNALRHGDPPVLVKARPDGDAVEIVISDSGPGVPAHDIPFLFERFSSADQAPQSVGLGLWIVRLLTEAHDGVVTYRAGSPGAEFVVQLPHRPGGAVPLARVRGGHA